MIIYIIIGSFDGQTPNTRLPVIEKTNDFWFNLKAILKDIGCCENLFHSAPFNNGCSRCIQLNSTTNTSTTSTTTTTIPTLPVKQGNSYLNTFF